MDSASEPDHKLDSVIRLRKYVKEYKLQRGEEFVEIDKENVVVTDKANSNSNSNSVSSTSTANSKTKVSDALSSEEPKTYSKTDKTFSKLPKDFMDMSISSSSTISNMRDFDDDYITPNRGRLFISTISSDDDDDDALIFQPMMDFTLADQGLGSDAIYNDWDSGLSHSSLELTRDGNDDNRSWVHTSNFFPPPDSLEQDLDFPHRALRVMVCQICLEKEYLRRRVCCDFQICNKCIVMYITGKVQEGKVQIECANDRCNALMYKEEIRHRLPLEVREKFIRFLIDANKDPHEKTCPSCSVPFKIDPARLKISKRKLKLGVQVTCTQCNLVWCFRCQAPFHKNMTCKAYRNEDEMVRRWAKEKSYGQVNAQKCPKCKIFVQKMDGCDHMKCTQCETDFCYRCGDRYISVKFFGSHWNRFSLFGCKYRLMPEKNCLRRLIRGSHFFGRVLAAVVIAGLGVAAGAVLVAGSVVIVPGYGIFVLRRRMWAAKQRKKFDRVKMRMINMAEKQQAMMLEKQIGNLETVVEESEIEYWEHPPDPQQIQVIVHHPEEEASAVENNSKDCDIIVNRYVNVNEDTETALSQSTTKESEGANAAVSDSKEASSDGKNTNTKLVIHTVPSRKQADMEKMEDNVDSGIICDEEAGGDDGEEAGGDDGEHNSRLEKEESRLSETGCENNESSQVEKENKDVSVKEQRKMSNSELKSLQSLGDNSDNVGVVNDNAQINQSLSKGEDNLSEKIIWKKMPKADNDNKNAIPLKTDGENGGKGCFGNIFNVGKRTTSNNISCEEEWVKLTQEKFPSFDTRKAATWEKSRRDRVEMGLPGVNNSSSIDTDNDCTNNPPLIVHRSSSSVSSIVGYSFTDGDEVDKKRFKGYRQLDDNPLPQPISSDSGNDSASCVSRNEHDVDNGCPDTSTSDVNSVQVEYDVDEEEEEECVKKIKLEIADVDWRSTSLQEPHHSGHVSPISVVTHL